MKRDENTIGYEGNRVYNSINSEDVDATTILQFIWNEPNSTGNCNLVN